MEMIKINSTGQDSNFYRVNINIDISIAKALCDVLKVVLSAYKTVEKDVIEGPSQKYATVAQLYEKLEKELKDGK